ncbi:MAG: Nucleoside 2-deoxyribosyltransferase [candidate division TM6 bacterium GW2011_GWF2_37_49]|nr:MAG: Nucleoside 2-deoxyribosyltransferase [candidate division TM6 bacterium GW2011_GWF2_37_49]
MHNICLIGDILVDVTLKNKNEELKMRLGGISHSARALWAISSSYSLGYISPKYLDTRIHDFFDHYDSPKLIKIAETLNAPNIILIEEAREIGNQGYELILREDNNYEYKDFDFPECDSFLITSGQYDISRILKKTGTTPVSLELANLSIEDFVALNYKFKNIYISTSSKIFQKYIENNYFNFESFASLFKRFCDTLVFKENRGGTRVYNFNKNEVHQVSSQTKPIQHSVGVGDVFNAIFESEISNKIDENLALASFIAMEYASTTYPKNFKNSVEQLLNIPINELVSLEGTILNWEHRKNINIYIAAPDFDFVDTSLIDTLEKSLLYHNFSPRRPIRENGQMKENDTLQQKQQFYFEDIRLLNECCIVICVLLYNDPGTLVEIGIASEKQIPVLLYDPYNIVKNCMLSHSCSIVTNNMDEIISETFIKSSKICKT